MNSTSDRIARVVARLMIDYAPDRGALALLDNVAVAFAREFTTSEEECKAFLRACGVDTTEHDFRELRRELQSP